MPAAAAAIDTVAELALRALAQAALHAAVVAAAVLALTSALRRWLPPAARYGLWGLVALRLALPVVPSSPTSLFNLGFLPRPASPPAGITPPPGHAPAGPTITIGLEPLRFDALRPAPAAPPARPPSLERGWMRYLAAAWLAGACGVLLAAVVAARRLSTRLRSARVLDDPAFAAALSRAAAALGMRPRRLPRLLETPAVASPALAGLRRPAILFPPGLAERLSRDELHFVLLHELAHLQRCDLWLDALLVLVRAAHWFNPLAWWALARLRAERELARDAIVLRALAGDGRERARAYGSTLLRLTESIARRGGPGPLTAALGHDARLLRRRLQMIVDRPRSGFLVWALAIGCAAAVVAVTMTSAAPARARQDAPPPPPPRDRRPTSGPASSSASSPTRSTTSATCSSRWPTHSPSRPRSPSATRPTPMTAPARTRSATRAPPSAGRRRPPPSSSS